MAVESMRDFLAQDHAALLRAIPDIPLRLMNAVHSDEQSADFDRFHPDCAVTPFEGAGHFVMLERPEVFNTALRTMLSDVHAHSLSQSTTQGALT